MNKSDNSLLLLIAEKNSEAFKQLYNKYIKLLYKFVFQELNDEQLTDDLIQEFWLKVWENPHFLKCDEHGSARGYLLQYIKFRILDVYRKSKRRLILSNNDVEIENEESTIYNNIIENLNEKELVEVIMEALEEQSPIVQRTFWMRINNWSVEETATKLSISPKTVYNRYSESLSIVRKHILKSHPEIVENFRLGINDKSILSTLRTLFL